MKNLDLKCVELLKENYCRVIKTTEDAEAVLRKLRSIVIDENLEKFITDDLCVFSSRTEAFNWFEEDEAISIYRLKNISEQITPDMVGLNWGDAIETLFLNEKENYICVNDKIHLTYWM